MAEAAEESRLGEESREEEGSEDREWGDIGLPRGETANMSATQKPVIKADSDHTNVHAASPHRTSPAMIGSLAVTEIHSFLIRKLYKNIYIANQHGFPNRGC